MAGETACRTYLIKQGGAGGFACRCNKPHHRWGIPLWLERQGGFSGRTGVNQLERMDALGLAAVLEENQSRLGKGAVAFRKRGLLNSLCHRALYPYRDLDRRRGRIGLTLLTLSAAAQTGFRL